MEKRLSYIVVGTFVITITLSLFFFLFWLAKYGNENIEHDYYKTYFQESVSGLNVESLVKLKGVEVGRVKKISINKDDSEEVEVVLEIIKDTPIKEDTYTVLDSQGITGLKYIELKGGLNNSKKLASSQGEMGTIPSKKSVMSQLFDSSESITDKVDVILNKINKLLNNKNLENIQRVVDNLATTTDYIDENTYKVDDLFLQIDSFLEHTKKFERDIIPPLMKIGVMSDKAGEASDRTGDFFIGMQKELDNGEFSLSSIVEQNLQILNETSLSIRNLSLKLEETVESLKDSPSDLLYKSNEKILGPGESNE